MSAARPGGVVHVPAVGRADDAVAVIYGGMDADEGVGARFAVSSSDVRYAADVVGVFHTFESLIALAMRSRAYLAVSWLE